MKHLRIEELYPYTYFIRNKETGDKYYGVRYGNLKLGLTPEQDLGIKYFTSSKVLSKDFKENIEKYDFKVHYTFDTVDEALDYEHKFLTKVYKRLDWINKTNNKSFDERKIERDYDRSAAAMKSSETMSDDIVDGLNMHHRRNQKGLETRKRTGALERAGRKISQTKRHKDENGVSNATKALLKGWEKIPKELRSERAKNRYKKWAMKLVAMSDEEFEEFIKKYTVKTQNNYRTLRKNNQ